MIIAIDVYYQEKRAKAVGVVFEYWEDSKPLDVIVSYTDDPGGLNPTCGLEKKKCS